MAHDPSIRSQEGVKLVLTAAVERAALIAARGVAHIDAALAPRRRKAKREAWLNDPELCTWFGEDAVTVRQMRAVRRRLRRMERRVAERTLRLRIRPQSDAPSEEHAARNLGTGATTPLRFTIYTHFFRQSAIEQGGIIVHELMHDWFFDQKLKNGDVVYGPTKALALAREAPRKARRSPENYRVFCMVLRG
jgi:hypothetical protein